MSIEIRPLTTYAEYLACEELQSLVWGGFGVVPNHLLITVQRSDGLVLGAFDTAAAGQLLVGFVFGFLGRTADGMIKHCSHMAAVHPDYRDRDIGARLKQEQRRIVAGQGIELITWTFDPLLSRNARLNIRKLGGVVRTYIRNIYGPEPETPEVLPSDRFLVEWWVNHSRVVERAAGTPPPALDELRAGAVLLNPALNEPPAPIAGPRLLLQIPADFMALHTTDYDKAHAWRFQVRALAEAAFAAGYVVTEYDRDAGGEMGFYVLELANVSKLSA